MAKLLKVSRYPQLELRKKSPVIVLMNKMIYDFFKNKQKSKLISARRIVNLSIQSTSSIV